MRKLQFRYSQINSALVDQTMVSGVNFLTGIILVRYLGMEEFGRFTLAWLIVLFFNSIHFAAVISPMMSIGPKQPETAHPQYYGAVFLQQFFWTASCCILIFLSVWGSQFFFDWNIHDLAVPLSAALLAFQCQDFLRRYFFVREDPAAAFTNDCISYLGRLLLLIFCYNFRALSIIIVLWIIAFCSALAAVIGFIKAEELRLSKISIHKMMKEHWHFSKWLIVSAIMQWASGNFFLIAAGGILGTFAVGAVKAAQNIIGIAHILFQAMENFVPSKAANEFAKGGPRKLLKYLRSIALTGGLFIAIIAISAAIFSDILFRFIYGGDYIDYSFLLKWFSLIYFLGFFIIPLSAGLRAIERTKPLFTSLFFMSLVSVAFAYPLILFFGLNGVMIGITAVKLGTLFYLSSYLLRCLYQLS